MGQCVIAIIIVEPWDYFFWHQFLQNNPINVESVGDSVDSTLISPGITPLNNPWE
jgi:hypothetical protein